MYSVQDLKNDLTGVMHGTRLNQIYNLEGVIDRAARQLLLDCDPQETIREVAFTTPVFDSVYEYALADDVKGISILDIRPQVNRTGADIFNQDYSQQFNLAAQQNNNGGVASQFNIKFNSSLKTIEVNSATAPPAIIVNTASGVTINGTWVQSSVATAPTTNNVNWVANGGSIQFNIAAGANPTVGTMINSTQSAVDLSGQLNQSSLFLWTYLPNAAQMKTVRLTWGSSSLNYYTAITAVTQANTAFQTGWNQLAFAWNPTNVTTVGTPNPASITYIAVDWVTDGTLQTGVLLNNITCSGGQILNYLYYSKYLFRDFVTGAFQETVTDDSNLINLDTESYNLLFYQTALLASQQQQGRNALQYDGKFFSDKYDAELAKYKLRYRSQTQKPRHYYYKKPNPSYGWGAGWWWSR
jgi:hypothetical protein